MLRTRLGSYPVGLGVGGVGEQRLAHRHVSRLLVDLEVLQTAPVAHSFVEKLVVRGLNFNRITDTSKNNVDKHKTSFICVFCTRVSRNQEHPIPFNKSRRRNAGSFFSYPFQKDTMTKQSDLRRRFSKKSLKSLLCLQ